MSIDSRKFNDRAKETEQALSDYDKKNSDKSLKLESKRVNDTVNNLLKKEIKEVENENFVDAYSNTPSSNKISKSRSLSLSSSVYSTKLLEKLVQAQSDNEFTRATLTYQESSLKLLEEIKNSVDELKPKKSSEEANRTEDLERSVSTLAKSIAELDIPGLFKELKKSAIKMFDSSGMVSNIEMVMEILTSTFSDRSQFKDIVKGKFKKGVLKSIFGEKMADKIGKFETEPLEVIQDFINMGANSNNQFLRALLGRHSSGVELKLGKKERDDHKEKQELNDKLTYNTLNFRIPESLDRIEAALTGKEKTSYDYTTNTYYTNTERVNNLLKSGEIFDLKTSAKELLNSFKESLTDMFDDGKLSKEIASQFLNYDEKEKRFKYDKQGRLISKDDDALEDLIMQMVKSKVDMRMIAGSNLSPEAFLRQNQIKINDKIGKARTINAVNTLNRILSLNPEAFTDEMSESLIDIKRRASSANLFKEEYSLMSPEQIHIIEQFREGSISRDEMLAMMDDLEESKRRTIRRPGGYGPNGPNNPPGGSNPPVSSSNKGSKKRIDAIRGIKFSRAEYSGSFASKAVNDRGYKSFKDVNDFGKGINGSNIVRKGSKNNEYDSYVKNLESLMASGIMTNDELKLLQPDVLKKNKIGFSIDENTAKTIDKKMIQLGKATELYNLFLNAKLVPQLLAASTGQSYDYWVSQGYPTCPQDLFPYITFDQDNNPVIDFDSLASLNVKFTQKYIDNLTYRNRVNSRGIDVDVMDPERTMNKALNEAFRDPTLLSKIGLKSGAGAGYFLGKILQAKGVLSSPVAPYLLGGVGAMIMNMKSVQDRINMVLGPEGDLKGKSGFTNREIAMAKFFNKTLPRVGLGGYVAKSVYKMFSGGGLTGTGIGLIGGGLLGLLTAAVAPSLMKFGREKLFGDDGEGNKGFWKGVGSILKNVSWIDKYLSTNISKGDSDLQLAAGTMTEMDDELGVRISELQDLEAKSNGNLPEEDKQELAALLKLRHNMSRIKEQMFKENGVPKKKDNEDDDAYANRIKKIILDRITNSVKHQRKNNSSFDEYMGNFEKRFESRYKARFDKREILRDHDGDLSDLDFDTEVKKRNLDRELEKEYIDENDPELTRLKKIFNDAEDSTKGEYQGLAEALLDEIDSSGDKKENAMEFKKYLRSLHVQDADEALSAILDENSKKRLLEGDAATLIELIKSNADLKEVFSTLNEFKTVNEDFLNNSDLEFIRKVARLKSRALSNDPDKDKQSVELREEEIFQALLGEINKKSLGDRFDDKTFKAISSIKKLYSNLTGDVGYMDSEERDENKRLFQKIHSLDIFNNPEFQELIKEYDEQNLAESIDENTDDEDEDSGSGSYNSPIKMKNLKRYSFQNGKPLNLFGCSIAAINNLMAYLKVGSMDIEELIKYANNHLNNDGSVRDTFFTEMAERLGLKLTVNTRKVTGGFDKKFVQSIKIDGKTGYILLKHNPGLNYGHFVNIKSTSNGYFIIDDPELNGTQKYSIADIMAITDAVYKFELYPVIVENDVRHSIKDKISNTKNKLSKLKENLIKSLTPDALKNKLQNKAKSLVSDFNSTLKDTPLYDTISKVSNIFKGKSSSEDNRNPKNDPTNKVIELTQKVIDILTSGMINVKIVDDETLPLKLTDGSVSKFVGDNKERINSKDPSILRKFFNKMRKTPVATAEFKKEDQVQDAIINGVLSGAGSGAAKKAKFNEKGSTIKENGLMPSILSNGVNFLLNKGKDLLGGGAMLEGARQFIKRTFGKKGTDKVGTDGIKTTNKPKTKTKTKTKYKWEKKTRKVRMKKAPRVKANASETKNLAKIGTKLKGVLNNFFSGLFKRAPKKLVAFVGGLTKSLSKFITNLTTMFTKFVKANTKTISKKIAKKSVEGTTAKIPWVNIAVGLAFFSYSFYEGYKDAAEILKTVKMPFDNPDGPSVVQKIAVGFTKGVAVALPSYLLSALNFFLGAAFEVFMEEYGFMAILEWFMSSHEESVTPAQKISSEDVKKAETELDNIEDKEAEKNNAKNDAKQEALVQSPTNTNNQSLNASERSKLQVERQNLVMSMTTDDFLWANLDSRGALGEQRNARIAEIDKKLGNEIRNKPTTAAELKKIHEEEAKKEAIKKEQEAKNAPKPMTFFNNNSKNMYQKQSYAEAMAKSMVGKHANKPTMFTPTTAAPSTASADDSAMSNTPNPNSTTVENKQTQTPAKDNKTVTLSKADSPKVENPTKQDTNNTSSAKYGFPLKNKNAVITSTFGMRFHPKKRKWIPHEGIDIYQPEGTNVIAVADGEVIEVNDRWGFVKIKHADNTVTGYMHMLSHNVKVGDKIKKGDVIGKVGGRGPSGPRTFGPHLHFSYQRNKNSKYEDPFNVIGADPNNIKLAPKSQVDENVRYLNEHPALVAKLNPAPRNNYIASGGNKGGPDSDAEVKETSITKESIASNNESNKLSSVISDLSKSIKGLTNIPTNLNNKEVQALGSTLIVEKITELNALMMNLIKISATQVAKMDILIDAISSNNIDPSEMRAMNMSRMKSF